MHFSPVLDETLKISRRLGWRGKRVLCRGFASSCWYENNLSGKMNMAGGFAVAAFALLLVAVNQKCICLLQLDETPHVKGKAYGAHVLAEPSFWTLRRTATETKCVSMQTMPNQTDYVFRHVCHAFDCVIIFPRRLYPSILLVGGCWWFQFFISCDHHF